MRNAPEKTADVVVDVDVELWFVKNKFPYF